MTTRNQPPTYSELHNFLLTWRSIGDPSVYDLVGMAGLLDACLLNLRQFSLESEWEQLTDSLGEESREFLIKLAQVAQGTYPGLLSDAQRCSMND